MKHWQLKYNYIKAIDSWDNPIVKNNLYDDCQIAEFTGCWDQNDKFYEVLFYKDKEFCLDSETGENCDLPETDNWLEDDKTYIYYDEETNTYYEQNINGNFWYLIDEPILVPPF